MTSHSASSHLVQVRHRPPGVWENIIRITSEDVNVDIQVFIMKTTEAKNSDKEQTHWREINRRPVVCENIASTIALSCSKTNEIAIITNKECLDHYYLWSDRRGYQGSDCYRVSRARSPGCCTAGNHPGTEPAHFIVTPEPEPRLMLMNMYFLWLTPMVMISCIRLVPMTKSHLILLLLIKDQRNMNFDLSSTRPWPQNTIFRPARLLKSHLGLILFWKQKKSTYPIARNRGSYLGLVSTSVLHRAWKALFRQGGDRVWNIIIII